jgi:hypothetical protein
MNKEHDMTRQPIRHVILLLAIGVVLVFRMVLHAGAMAFGIDLVGLAGLTCMIVALILAYHLRRQINASA